MWLNGPSWLSHSLPELDELEYCLEDFEDEVAMNVLHVNAPLIPFPSERWGSFPKVLNCVAWVFRFINNCKPGSIKLSGSLSHEEMQKAKFKVFLFLQREHYQVELNSLTKGNPLPRNSSLRNLDPFLDSHGLLRIKGRLEYAELFM